MNILHFKRTMRAEDGGVVKAVLDLCAASNTPDNTVTLATADHSAVHPAWVSGETPGIRVEHLAGAGRSLDRLGEEQLKAMSRQVQDADVVHLHSMWGIANIQVAAICRQHRTPYALSVHGMLDDWCMSQRKLKKIAFLKTFNRSLLSGAAAIHCTAQAELDQASKWIPAGKGVVVPLPLDLTDYRDLPDVSEAFDAMPEIRRGVPVVLFLSRIHYKKGLDRLIEASALLHKRGVRHQLVVAGTGEGDYPDRMRAMSRECGIEEHTRFVGFVSGRTKVALLRAADLFALPTSQENFGFVYFEALASGTRVLTTKGTDTWPELEASGAGTIADNTPEAFADAIGVLLDAPETETNAAEASGRSWVFDNLSPERIRDGYQSLYERITAGVNA